MDEVKLCLQNRLLCCRLDSAHSAQCSVVNAGEKTIALCNRTGSYSCTAVSAKLIGCVALYVTSDGYLAQF